MKHLVIGFMLGVLLTTAIVAIEHRRGSLFREENTPTPSYCVGVEVNLSAGQHCWRAGEGGAGTMTLAGEYVVIAHTRGDLSSVWVVVRTTEPTVTPAPTDASRGMR